MTERKKKKKASEDAKPAGLSQLPFIINFHSGGLAGSTGVSELRSSSPNQGGNDIENLELYLEWALETGKINKVHHDKALQGLRDEGFGYNSLRDVDKALWKQWGVGQGAQIAILRSQKIWPEFRDKALVEKVAAAAASEPQGHTMDNPEKISDDEESAEDEGSSNNAGEQFDLSQEVWIYSGMYFC